MTVKRALFRCFANNSGQDEPRGRTASRFASKCISPISVHKRISVEKCAESPKISSEIRGYLSDSDPRLQVISSEQFTTALPCSELDPLIAFEFVLIGAGRESWHHRSRLPNAFFICAEDDPNSMVLPRAALRKLQYADCMVHCPMVMPRDMPTRLNHR